MSQQDAYSQGCEVKYLLNSKTSVDLVEFNIIPLTHDMMHQTNDCSPVWVMQHKVDPALGPAALGLGRPGALPSGLVQPCPKPQALIHKPKSPFNSKCT